MAATLQHEVAMFAAVATPLRLFLPILIAALSLLTTTAGAQRLGTRTLTIALPGPTEVTAGLVANGVQVAWKGVPEAVQYLVLRGPDAVTPGSQIAALPGDAFTFTDVGFNAQAGYQVVAVAADRRQGASAIVLYTPPAMLDVQKMQQVPIVRRAAPAAPSGAPPVIAPWPGADPPNTYAHNGETVVVTGSGLDGLMSIALWPAWKVNGKWVVGGSSQLQAYPMTPVTISPTGFSFVVNAPADPLRRWTTPYVLIVTKPAGVDTSDGAIHLSNPEPTRKITGIAQTIIRSGARLKITGVGLGDVLGGYFGPGVYGSQTNPLWSVMNRSDTQLEIQTTAACNQEGPLMLHSPRPGGGTPILITADTTITAACYQATPAGAIDGAAANGVFHAASGNTIISIRGTNLKAVTRAIDQHGRGYPVTYVKVGATEFINFKIGSNFSPGNGLGFGLENVLIDPSINGAVTGSVLMMTPATFNRISPAWAEPGQKVRINGHNLSSGVAPQVTVGGIAAQVITWEPLVVDFRVPATATAGPVAITTSAGTTQLTGSFSTGVNTTHPGFFVVTGPSSVTAIVAPQQALATGDTIVVQGQNLARLNGICVTPAPHMGMPAGAMVTLPRTDNNMGYATSNTELRVVMQYAPNQLLAGPVKLSAPTQPPGDYMPSTYACVANPGGVQWP